MKLLYIGFAVDRELENKLHGISVAGNKMQINLLKKLYKQVDSLNVISIYPNAAYPKDRELVIKSRNVSITSGTDNIMSKIPFMLNLPVIKNLFEMYSTYREAKKIIQQNDIHKVLIFNAFPSTAYAALRLQKKYGCEITCLLADLPIDDSVKTKGLMKYLRARMDLYTKKAIKKMDKIIALNESAAELYAPNVPHIVMEGAVDVDQIDDFRYVVPARRNIVFTGSLQKHNGIVEVVDAFKLLKDEDVELDIYGRGEYTDYVIEASKHYPNIHYCGQRSNDEILLIQKEAFALINPRPVSNYISQVTFPSKIFEYMLSGTPVITTRLNGFHPEYYDTMYFVEDNTVNELVNGIKMVLSQTPEQLRQKAYSAYRLVVDKKNWQMQSERIVKFLKGNNQ